MADHELYGKLKRSMAEIFNVGDENENAYCCGDSGVVFFLETGFAYVLGHKTCTHGSTEADVVFGDGTIVRVAGDKIKIVGDLMGLGCFVPENMDTTLVKAVEFYQEKLLPSESVLTLTFKASDEPPDLTPGFVSLSEELQFYHTCRQASILTKDGAPVFKKDGRFVGLCNAESCGMLVASSVRSLAQTLSDSYRIDSSGINDVLQHVYASAMLKNDTRMENDSSQA